jgi:hypothetical protein
MTAANSLASPLRLVPLLAEPYRDVSVVECHAASSPAGSVRVSVSPGDELDSQQADLESQQEKRVPTAVRRYTHRFRLVVVSQDLVVPCYC